MYDVVVVGAGHAGIEAAAAAARLGRRTVLVTFDRAAIGRLSCNPAFGGQGKGHLVREVDALGGLVGRAADRACLQFRRLNTRKGLAVQSSRAQVDVDQYPAIVSGLLDAIAGLTIVEAEATALRIANAAITGVVLADGRVLDTAAVILTTGTFLRAVMHRGLHQEPGGRVGEGAAHRLAHDLKDLGLPILRLKTGTPARLDGRTIGWDRIEKQEEVADGRFSFEAAPAPRLGHIDVGMTYTNEATHAAIRGGLDRSPLFSGAIEGTGPRYCPSIEDKVVRFSDRDRHLVFVEPMGLNTHAVYPNGLSTSLPEDVQDAMLRSVPGFEQVAVMRYGYAVEYDAVDPASLGPDLSHKAIAGLWFAGQICGTSGYEEAAAQGFVAGVSAATGTPFVLKRSEAYIGVMLDDLVSKGIGGEPYRMFTSRAEHRLVLREDNADRRLMAIGRVLGLVDDATWAAFERRLDAIERGRAAFDGTTLVPDAATNARLVAKGLVPLRRPSTLSEILRRPEVEIAVAAELGGLAPIDVDVAAQLEIDVKYAGYVVRAEERARLDASMDDVVLPDVEWGALTALSTEVRQRLARAQPRTLGQVKRLPGVTPAAVGVVAAWLTRRG